MLLFVLLWAVVRGVDEGAVWGFIGGLIVDLLSGGPLGVTALSLMTVAVLASQAWGRGIGSPTMRLVPLAFAAGLTYHLVMLTALAWTGHPVDWGRVILQVAGPSALLNAVLAPFVQLPLNWMERRLRRETLFVV
jgi:rod shape-determining protein MreD